MSKLEGHESFVQALPGWAGFVPDESLLIAVFDKLDRIKEVVLVESDADARYFTDLYPELARRGAHSLAFVAIASDSVNFLLRAVQPLTLPVHFMVCMSVFEPGAPMVELVTQHYSRVPDYRLSETASRRVYRGWEIFGNRKELRNAYTRIEPSIPNRRTRDVAGSISGLEDAVRCGGSLDVGVIGGLLIRSKAVRAQVLQCADVDPQAAHVLFTEAARQLRGPARIHALTAAGIAALRAGEMEFARAAAEVGQAELDASATRMSGMENLRVLATLVKFGIVPQDVGEYWSQSA